MTSSFFIFFIIPLSTGILLFTGITLAVKRCRRKMAKERSPLDMIHEKIKRRIDQLPEKALQRKITINGRGGKGQHTLAELKRMPRLIPFITERDLWDQFPGVLKKRTEKRHPVTPFS